MRIGSSPSVIVLPAPASVPTPGRRAFVGTIPPAPAMSVYRRRLRWLASALAEAGGMLAIVYCIPLVIIAVGTPAALVVWLLAWLTGTL